MSLLPGDPTPRSLFVTDEMRAEICRFQQHLLSYVGRPPPPILWHYTNFAGLEGILCSKSIFTTQHSCLNDSMEYLHLPKLITDELARRIPSIEDPLIKDFCEAAHRELSNVDISGTGNFVACLSEDEDDLGQWRGYGGGVCGYAIGFRADDILKAIARRPDTLLMPMEYREEMHRQFASEVIEFSLALYQKHVATKDIQQFGAEVRSEIAQGLDIIVSLVKHPKFKFENERRIATKLLVGEHENLQFRQKQTLLARHLPLSLLADLADTRLPIEKVMVGPGPAQRVTQIAVGDLLVRYGYDPKITDHSRVPYRVP